MAQKDKKTTSEKNIKKKDSFSAISIKAEVAVMFRDYSKRFDRPHSEVLYHIILFLKRNHLNPFNDGVERISKELKAIEKRLTKQTDHLISIIKNMERTKINPMYEMVLALYTAHINSEGKKKTRWPKRRDDDLFALPKPKTVPKYEHDMLMERYEAYKRKCKKILDSTKKVEPLVGKPYMKIKMDIKLFNSLKNELK